MIYRSRFYGGFTLVEILIVLAIIGILAVLFFSFLPFRNLSRDMTRALQGEMQRTKGEAMANTLAQRLLLLSNGDLRVESALSCSKAENTTGTVPVTNWKLVRDLPRAQEWKTVTVTTDNTNKTPDIIACYSPRGFADKTRVIQIADTKRTYRIELALAGGVRSNAN